MRKFLLILAIVLWCVAVYGQAAVPCVNRYITNQRITQNQFDAMVDFTFNVGCGAFRSSTLLKRVNANDIAGTANEFPRWVYAGGKRLRGLVARRERERTLFLTK